jgi:DUF4097 and DUF4098 domain-containing protein YvlB
MPDGNSRALAASLPVMRHELPTVSPDARADEAQARALWVLLAAGLFLLAAAAVSGSEPGVTVSRTDRFQATLSPGSTVRIENVNGDVVANRGASFSAVVTTTVTARDRARADEILGKTRIEQSSDGKEYRLETAWPGSWGRGHERRHSMLGCRECKIVSRYELTLPAGFAANLQTVNGDVRVVDVDGNLEVQSVNGTVQVSGARRSLDAQTVNGRVEATAAALPEGASWRLQTVNGAVVATLPKNAKFDWSASTLGGTIASTFPLPPRREDAGTATPAPPETPHTPHPRRTRVVVPSGDDGDLVDVEELAREVEDSLREAELEVHGENPHRMQVMLPERGYSARVGGGGPRVQASALNGNITLLAEGTKEADAKPLVAGRRTITVTVPRVEVRVPRVIVRVPRVREAEQPGTPEADAEPEEPTEEEDIVRGDVAGDFFSSSNGSYRVGHVTGRVKILTHQGEVQIASAGKGAEIRTFGGDIRLGPIAGDLKAQTLAGDVRVGVVAGSAFVDTSGGDIRIDRVGGSATAKTLGGDIVIAGVGGGINAETGGGEVRIVLLARQAKGGVAVRNAGGDVLLTLPADFQGDVDLQVEDPGDSDDVLIRSEFPGITVARSPDAQRATGSLNGGGPRVSVRTSSGSIRLRRGPASGS